MPSRPLAVLLVLLLLLPAALGPAEAARRPAQAEWTVMVYMAGDNDLERFVVRDIEQELAALGSSAAVQVVALADRKKQPSDRPGDWSRIRLFHVTKGITATNETAVAHWGEKDTGNPRTLVDFVAWTRANYPAERYALFFWGHGWSWHPGWVMTDATGGDGLNANEVREVLPKIGFIDVVGFDSCNMAAIETQALWQGHAAALVASQEWVGWDGLAYDRIVGALRDDPKMDAARLAAVAARSPRGTKERTWSAVALGPKWENLQAATDDFARALLAGMPGNRGRYVAALRATQRFAKAPMDRDLRDFAAEVAKRVADPAIDRAAARVVAAVDAVIIEEWHQPEYADAFGITIYLPPDRGDASWRYYPTLDFARATAWDQFLTALRPVGR